MKFASGTLAVIVALATVHHHYLSQHVDAFAPPATSSRHSIENTHPSSFAAFDNTVVTVAVAAATTTTTTDAGTADISIPYDAAAELAYDEWIVKYNKPFDATRRDVFKANYKAIAVMNVSAKKVARDNGTPDSEISLLALNEYADCTTEEYEAAMTSTSTGDILGEAVAAVESQSAASDALREAADALAEEEQVSFV